MPESLVTYLTADIIKSFIIFQALIILLMISNICILHRTGKHPRVKVFPRVSILIPARNEERNISGCLSSLLFQDYPNFEVIVYDDQSSDNTLIIAQQFTQRHSNLKVIIGQPPPPGWIGKNWACHELAQAASGEVIFFTDADTKHSPNALGKVIDILIGENADMLTGLPRQEIPTWGERLLVPLFPWSFFVFSPLFLFYTIPLPALSSASGQLMVFRKKAYEEIGGHASIKNQIVEDMALVRKTKAGGLRWRIINVTGIISCRMYHGFIEAFRGLTKNLFAAFDYRVLSYLFVWTWLALMFLQPIIILFLVRIGLLTPNFASYDIFLSITLSLAIWIFSFANLRLPAWLALIYPLLMLVFLFVVFSSFWLTISGKTQWKGRPLGKPRIRF